MPILSAGKANKRRAQRGVTLMELLIVMAIIGLMTGVTFPSISAGLESMKFNAAANDVAAFLNRGLNRAERRQVAVELVISPKENKLELFTNEPGFTRELVLPEGIVMEGVFPKDPEEPEGTPHRVVVMPGATAPAVAVQLANARGNRKIVRVDPMTGFPHIESVIQK
jgi:prepilin-type N-terminal cleavage/methylation domain-containing protein